MPFVDALDQPELWSSESPAEAWSVRDGVLALMHPADPEADVAVQRDLDGSLAGFVRVVVRYQADVDAALSVRSRHGEARSAQICQLPKAADWAEVSCTAHLAADRTSAGLTAALGEAGALRIDEIRITPIGASDEVQIPSAGPLPSALDTLAPGGRMDLPEGYEPKNFVRSKLFARPTIGLAVNDRVAVRLGAGIGHRWWTAAPVAVQFGGETVARISAPAGAASGLRLDAASTHGPWLGPVGLRVGPVLRLDREVWGAEELPFGASLGLAADLGLDVGPVALSAGVQPLWPLAPDRERETAWRGGVRVAPGAFELGLDAAWRDTAIGDILEGSLSFAVRFP